MADAAARGKDKATNWADPQLMEAILTQIIAVGKVAFMTSKANLKPNATTGTAGVQYNQKEVWTNERDGIITMLKKHPQKLFENVTWAKEPHVALLQAVERYLNANAHLYTPGMEQAEPAAAAVQPRLKRTIFPIKTTYHSRVELTDYCLQKKNGAP